MSNAMILAGKLYSKNSPAIELWCISFLLTCSFSTTTTVSGNETDRLALLAIKSQIHDPLGVLSSWNNSVTLCQWNGVTCGHRHQRVTGLELNFQSLGGSLSPYIGNLSFLCLLNLEGNNFYGVIPHEVGQLTSLISLGLGDNILSGMVPPSIYNISSLRRLNLILNQLHGSLPPNLGFTLPNLRVLDIGENNFSGLLPVSLSNASKLSKLDLSDCHFSGKVSINFNGLKDLSQLNLVTNNLGSGAAGDLDFITSLTNCSSLEKLGLFGNQFGGVLPNSLANLSTTLNALAMGNNLISGTIPSGIENLINLYGLSLQMNQLTGLIPHAIGKLKRLQELDLDTNKFLGRIPDSLGNLSLLTILNLGSNNLQGDIPPALGKCQNMNFLTLGQNRLTGVVPPQIVSITTLSLLRDLSDNLLTGSLPSEVGNLQTLVALNISGNQLSGEIPTTIAGCTSLEYLDLGENFFYGSIPSSLSSLRSITVLELSCNNLSGQIPTFFETLSFLEYLDLSYNQLEGEVPINGIFSNATAISVTGNDKLCGGLAELHLPSCNFKKSKKPTTYFSPKLILIIYGLIGFILLSSSILLCLFTKKKTKKEPSSASSSLNSILKVSYQQLLRATEGFSSANLIGEGNFGHVYKGILNQNQNKNIVAVKVMNLQNRGASKSFMAECETLRNIRHRNLVKIISACSSVDFQGNAFKALIYEFMPNGSLERWLHANPEANETRKEQRGLNFLQRLDIAIDVASALEYLHHRCLVPIVHCDLKPSNVLLDNYMVAHVGDFGLARFFQEATNKFSEYQTSSLGLKGTIGYTPPEYGMGNEATTSGDVYSYGILLLEMFTSKRPSDDMFKDGLNLHDYTKMALREQIMDPLLEQGEENATASRNPSRACTNGNKMQEYLISVLTIGVACSVVSPKDRMNISHAARELHKIRDNCASNLVTVGAKGWTCELGET